MLHRSMTAAAALAGTLLLGIAGAAAHDETRYPDWSGQWRRAAGNGIVWDENKPRGLAQQPPLTPEYQAIWEASMADQAAGGHGGDTRVTCRSNGMPRMAIIVRPMGFFIQPDMTLVVYDNNIPRWIYTDGREMPKDAEPSYAGYSIGKWLDTDGDGRFDTLDVETSQLQGPAHLRRQRPPAAPRQRAPSPRSGSRSDNTNKNILLNEITVNDHALTRPWTVVKRYQRVPGKVEFHEDLCNEDNRHVYVGNEGYLLSGDGYLMPTKKGQAPPDLRYFQQTKK